MTNKAYSFLKFKSVDDEERTIGGIATTPAPDRDGDIINPLGLTWAEATPLLWQHDRHAPVGNVAFGNKTAEGLEFKAKFPIIAEDGPLKERVDEAWQSVKSGLITAVSIGFMPKEAAPIPGGHGMHITAAEIYELSLVTIPSQTGALITHIKMLDVAQPGEPPQEAAEKVKPEQQPSAAPGLGEKTVKLDEGQETAAPYVIKKIWRLEGSI